MFATFVAKDIRRDELKDLVGSIESAENAYMSRLESRRMFNEFKNFKTEFGEFRKHPTTPYSGGGSSEGWDWSEDEIDYGRSVYDEESSTEELLDSIIRLFNKLPENKSRRQRLEAILSDRKKFWEMWDKLDEITTEARHVSKNPQTSRKSNKQIFRLWAIYISHSKTSLSALKL